MKYWYLMASVPTLIFGHKPPFSLDAFLDQCANQLQPQDREELDHAVAFDLEACNTEFAQSYLGFERGLRYRISAIRAGRLGLDTSQYRDLEGGYDTFVNRAVIDGFSKTDPRERAWTFDHTRWYMLDELAQFDPYGMSAVLATAFKLRLLERWQIIDEEPGRKAFQEHLDAIMDTLPEEVAA